MRPTYQPTKIEKKWQKFWQEKKLFAAKDFDTKKKKFYHLVMFPYPSGDLHIGHWFNFAPADTYARFKFMQSYNVLSPIGFDAFGLPAENAAIKRKIHPKRWTQDNIRQMIKQLESMGPMYDWSRVINTADPAYYQWTQWLFLQMYKKGLAYKKNQPANWCPSCQTVLANEQVETGMCFRCGSTIEIKEIDQWLFKITDYADRLLSDLDQLDWPEKTKAMQRNWIGKSEGAIIKFQVKSQGSNIKTIEVFTTRPDTIFGVTYLVIAPEHPFLQNQKSQLAGEQAKIKNQKEVEKYIDQTNSKTERERKEGEREKTGVFTGNYAINPATGKAIPIWVADYVLMGYGTGAIMAVPAHDKRDWEFAKKFNLPIVSVIASETKQSQPKTSPSKTQTPNKFQNLNEQTNQAYENEGIMVNSEQFNGLPSQQARQKITDWLESQGKAKKTTQYRLRDWIVSRQRYWGAPIPIIYCRKCWENLKLKTPAFAKASAGGQNSKLKEGIEYTYIDGQEHYIHAVPEADLPVKLPDIDGYLPKGQPPLATAREWVNTRCPVCHEPAKRETETMDTFVDSSWYFLRYPDPNNKKVFCDRQLIDYWCPVDIYIGGAEHSVLHLLYARFFTKVLHDLGYITFDEPFPKLRHQGLILGQDRQKMSKSRGNVVDPDELVRTFGSDTVRLYLMFMGPYDQGGRWSAEGIRGLKRFVDRIWRFSNFQRGGGDEVNKKLHHAIKKITEDLERLKFNTAIASLMDLLKVFEQKGCSLHQWQVFVHLLSPFTPHLAEELWSKLGDQSIFQKNWPQPESKYLLQNLVTIAVSFNGKTRGTVEVERDADQKTVQEIIKLDDRLSRYFNNQRVSKVIYLPSKIINFVVG